MTPQVGAYWRQLLQRLKELPNVESAALIDWLPMSSGREARSAGLKIVGRTDNSAHGYDGVMFCAVSADYFRAMQVPLIRGRHFLEQDEESSPWVAIVNEAQAHRLWPNQDAIGQLIVLDTTTSGQRPREVVGVVGNVRQFQLGKSPLPELYIPYPQQSQYCTPPETEGRLHLSAVVRVRSGRTSQMLEAMRQAARGLDRDVPIFGIQTMDDTVSGSVAMPRFLVRVLGAFAAVALLLAAIGIYGVTSYSVSDRRREIGLRLALGAQTGEVLRLVLKRSVAVASIGVVLGLAGSFAVTPLLRRLLYAELLHDLPTMTLVTLFLMAITILATYIPARRAMKVDPVVTLRHGS